MVELKKSGLKFYYLFLSFFLLISIQGNSFQKNPHGEINIPCSSCHVADNWKIMKSPMTFNHTSETKFPLSGSHQTAQCSSCHTKLNFQVGTYACQSCHEDIHKGTLGVNCETCHQTEMWSPLPHSKIIEIHNKGRFPLTGAHQMADCFGCHTKSGNGALFRVNNSLECIGCHIADYENVKLPDHALLGFPKRCLECHSQISWKPVSFNHDLFSFPLTGSHQNVPCESCHAGNIFKGTPKDCKSCHLSDFQKTNNPNHTAADFSTECQTCHSTFSWKPTSFDHNATSFPLTGGHITATCESCHKNDVFKGLSKNCYSCHQTDYIAVQIPNHVTGKFSMECQTCHATTTWKPSTFNHSSTAFPLTGGHITATCESCHKNGVFSGTSKNCVFCHQTNFDLSKNPNHIAAGFSTECQTCHSTFSWQPASFDHNTTAFPLTGNHTSVACASCHKNEVFKGLPSTCFSCHQTDYNNVVSPNHVTGQFSTDCQTCHTTSVWNPSSFSHNSTAFPLTGAHNTTSCESCHKNGVFKGTSKTCYPCHQSDFTKVTNPNHVSGKFPVNCETCHTAVAWKPSTFNHDGLYFPIYSGKHNGKWSSCVQCHEQSTNYKSFTCMSSGCHTKSSTDSKHHSVSGYSYTASACYSCHPKGKE